MKLGYIHSNREEQTRVMQVLRMTSESVALDELGIGRIRDAFADRMFPGISTLQKHMKYFSLMPQLYRKATEKRYNIFVVIILTLYIPSNQYTEYSPSYCIVASSAL